MQSVQRKFGKLMSKSPGDNAKIAAVLHDYEDAERLLGKIIENTTTLRDAWIAMATSQWAIVKEYEGLYDPIIGASEGHARPGITTPQLQLDRTFKLSGAYSDLKDELTGEVAAIDSQVIRPATEAREFIQPLRKTIKKRENKRLDYEKAQDKVKKLQKKTGRTAKEDAQLSKVEFEMSCASEEFEVADAHLRDALPPIIEAIFILIPHLLASHVCIQNRLLGLYYTALHTYCEDHDFPSPPPPMENVVSAWSASFLPVQREVEAISCIAHGKNWRQPARRSTDATDHANTFNHLSQPIRLHFRCLAATKSAIKQYKRLAFAAGPPNRFYNCHSAWTTPRRFKCIAILHKLPNTVVKKKPPPPPPAKRSKAPEEYVVAQYDFSGGDGDLSFREGDKIRIVKKTETEQDWWIGELGGVKGSFPANYCKTA
ncbi:SH3 domain signaling protein [Colletotrichum tofieldiae]|nr:SH3 domain signaling protein [Colletotrichum tofieldiae]